MTALTRFAAIPQSFEVISHWRCVAGLKRSKVRQVPFGIVDPCCIHMHFHPSDQHVIVVGVQF